MLNLAALSVFWLDFNRI